MVYLYAAIRDGVIAGRKTTTGWSVSRAQPAEDIECLAAGREAPERVFVGTAGAGLLRSDDAGETWDPVATFGDRVTAVTVHPRDPDVVWAGTEPSRIYRSIDAGDTWTERPGLTRLPSADRWSFPPRPHTHHVRWIAVHPQDPSRLAVAIEAGALVRTDDGGDTWRDHPEGARRDSHEIVLHPEAPNHLLVAAGDGYAESRDWGETWIFPQEGLDHRYLWSVAVDPANPESVFVSAARGAYAAHDPNGPSYVYRRVQREWRIAMEGLPGPDGLGRAVLAAGSNHVYAATNHGIFQWTTDAWHRVPVDGHWREESDLPQGFQVLPAHSS